ncbi:MAG: hypothetical protein IH619_03440 [Ignavibacterium sp.]|nr:hypothetical protein [Ignavibacterium sp.]
MHKEYRIERKQLYELVWSKPLTEVAKEFDVSDKAIAKICDKMNVPVPGVGYWRKIEVGEKVEKQKLPDVPPNFQAHHIISKHIPNYELVISEEAQNQIDYENDPANKIVVPGKRGFLHLLLKKTEISLKLLHTRSNILVSREEEGIFKISVSKSELNRVFRILNILVRELEQRKFPVYIDKGLIKVKIFGQEIGFSLKEKNRRIELPQKPGSYFKDYDYIPTGILILSIENIYVDHTIRKNFTDNYAGKVEDKLNEVMVALLVCSQAMIAERKYRDEQHKIYEEQQRKRDEIREKIKMEEKKVAELYNNIELFHKAKIIREYVEALRLKSSVSDQELKENEQYIHWALEQADRLDPLMKSPESILDLKEKVSGFW